MFGSVETQPIYTFLYYLQNGKSSSSYDGKNKEDEEYGIKQIRMQQEEDYKELVAPILAYFLTQLVLHNDQSTKKANSMCAGFNAQTVPDISIQNYLARIIKYTPCSAECFLVALIYIDRIVQSHHLLVNSLNIHRLLITSIMIAAKLFDDSTYNNKYYSHVGGVPLKELNLLEFKFLSLLNYELNVTLEHFDLYRYQAELQVLRTLHEENAIGSDQEGNQDEGQLDELDVAPATAVNSSCSTEARESARVRAKKLRRSRSFTNSTDSAIFKWRKRRSSSFNVLVVSA